MSRALRTCRADRRAGHTDPLENKGKLSSSQLLGCSVPEEGVVLQLLLAPAALHKTAHTHSHHFSDLKLSDRDMRRMVQGSARQLERR